MSAMAEDLEKKTAECEELKRVGVFLFFFLLKKKWFWGGGGGVAISDGPVLKKKKRGFFLSVWLCLQNVHRIRE